MDETIGHAGIILDLVTRYTIGIDEAGRGALAGPICVGAVLMPEDFDWREVFALITKKGEPRLRDSKQLTAPQRETLYERIVTHGALKHAWAMVEARDIDAYGIASAARAATARAASDLGVVSSEVSVMLDAGLTLPPEWSQESFVKGDETIPVISLASMIAKVARDRHMESLGKTYPGYGFEVHKGYGTSAHMHALRTSGMSPEHRRTFVHL